MGFWRRVVRAVSSLFGGGGERRAPGPDFTSPEPPAPPTGGDSGGYGGDGSYGDSGGDFPGRDFPFDFHVDGYLPMGGNQKDDYVNTAGTIVDIAPGGDIDWSNADYVVVRIVEPNGSTYWTSIVGPFDDYDDFLDHLQDWWEEGS